MLVLAIDTAGPDCAVALARTAGDEVEALAKGVETIGRGHAEILFPLIDAALAEAGARYPDLDRIAVTTGPGSFTGVRIGIAAARGLALALDRPAVGIGSLEAIAAPVLRTGKAGTVVAVLDARRGEVFALVQDIASGAVVREAEAIEPAALAAELRSARAPLVLIGSGAALLAAELAAGSYTVAGTPAAPEILDVARAVHRAGPRLHAKPVYIRGADAKPQAHRALARA